MNSTRRDFLMLSLKATTFVLLLSSTADAEPAQVFLQCTTTDGGENPESHFSIQLTFSDSTWKISKSDNVVKTTMGKFAVSNGTTILKAGGSTVAHIDGLNALSAQEGLSGMGGLIDETGRIFDWKVETVLQ